MNGIPILIPKKMEPQVWFWSVSQNEIKIQVWVPVLALQIRPDYGFG
jgi:hypothetical protein